MKLKELIIKLQELDKQGYSELEVSLNSEYEVVDCEHISKSNESYIDILGR